LLAVLLPGATLPRLWTAVALTYAVSGVVYVIVFRGAGWIKSAEAQARA